MDNVLDAMDQSLPPRFDDPVMDATRCFRAVLEAVSRPGKIVELDHLPPICRPLMPASYAIALTLFDHETPVWLDDGAASLAAGIRFHCGAPIAGDPQVAGFAIVTDPARLGELAHFAQGTAEYPDRSTTVILQVASFRSGRRFRVTGPGVNGSVDAAISGLPAAFETLWLDNARHAPMGVDLVLVCDTLIMGLPRSVKIQALNAELV